MLRPPTFDTASRLGKLQLGTLALTLIANTCAFFATLTPSWQVAEDLDTGRSVKSGLWIYCPGNGLNCWYIFSDDLINYYERVDVCRFLLIYDCRKKLLRTPYFFGWHYAVLVLMLVSIAFATLAAGATIVAHLQSHRRKVATIVLDVTLSVSFLLLCIALAVFMINGEMLESRYLIGVNNTYPKSYGFSYYLAVIGMVFMLFALLLAVLTTTSTFFGRHAHDDVRAASGGPFDSNNFMFAGSRSPSGYNNQMKTRMPPASPSDTSTLQTRTFISY